MIRLATISACGRYRYRLERQWSPLLPRLTFVMLNPSTADAEVDDPTIRKCIGFAERAGFGGIVVVNLSAFRATKPQAMFDHLEGEGALVDQVNHEHLCHAIRGQTVVKAWGAHGRRIPGLVRTFNNLCESTPCVLRVLDRLSDGTPAHPLMLPYDSARRPGGTL